MHASALATASVSRPKVHRPPFLAVQNPSKPGRSKRPLFFWGGVLLAVFALSVAAGKLTHTAPKDSLLVSQSSMLPPAISDAQAFSGPGKTIVLRGESETIIGQLAKIPLQHEQITEIKPGSRVDNNAGRELLSIISKY